MASTESTSNQRAARRAQQVKDRREQNARDRNAERQRRYEKNKRDVTILKVAAGVIAVGIVAALAVSFWNWGQDRELNRRPEGVVEFAYAGGQHNDALTDYSTDPDYQGEVPPAGGTHNNAWQNCGLYDAPIPWQNAVHSLEHGTVWIAYRPDLPADQIERLRAFGDDEKLLVAPEPLLTSPIVLTSWNNQLALESYDDETVRRYIRYFKNNAEFTPELGASCSGANSTTRPA